MSYPSPSFRNDVVLTCPPHELFVCDSDLVVVPFHFEDVWDTFVYVCLKFSGCCLGCSPCFLVVVLVTLHVFNVVLVTLHVFWLLSRSHRAAWFSHWY